MKINFNTYGWINDIQGKPKILEQIIKIGKLNTNEVSGKQSNLEIMNLAMIAGVADIYKSDETAWCAVAATAILELVGKAPKFTGWARLRAASFKDYGIPVAKKDVRLGDLVVFSRTGGGHIAFAIARDRNANIHVAGGNQSNQFNIVPIDESRAVAYRRPIYNVIPPGCELLRIVEPSGLTSKNEA